MKKKPDEPPKAPFNNPFAGLASRRDELPPGPTPAPEPEPRGPARAVVRLERKGHGGKEATVVDKLGLAGAELERWLKELKTALGCGGAVQGDALVLQGDQRERLRELLPKKGVRKVSVG